MSALTPDCIKGVFVYAFVDPKTAVVCYVGKTTIGEERLRLHLNSLRAGNHYNRRLQYLFSNRASTLGIELPWMVLEDSSREDLSIKEIAWIARLRGDGVPLCNGTDGGDGMLGRPCSPETRAKISASRSGIGMSALAHKKLLERNRNRVFSNETRAKLSAAQKGNRRGVPTLLRIAAMRRGKPMGEENRAALRAAKRNPNACARGAHQHLAKLNDEAAADIWRRLRLGERGCDLAKEFSVTQSTIHDLKSGRTWRHATGAAA